MNFPELVKSADYLDSDGQKLLSKTFEFADVAHAEHKRKTGEPYVEHPLRVAGILAALKLDATTLAAALLHDVPEDTPFSPKEIEKEFGHEVRELVEGVTKLTHLRAKDFKEEEQLVTFQRMFLAMAKDIRVVLIKLADRLDNMRTIAGIAPEKRRAYAKETLDIFAPLAARLGIGTFKGELEDLAFPYVFPEEYSRVVTLAGSKMKERQKIIEKVQRKLLRELAGHNIAVVSADGRVKHLYSLWRKLEKYDWDVSRINDLVALRVVVRTVPDCYATLGVIHKLWRPLPGRFDDYIATPKSSGYQSLHTESRRDGGG